MVCAHWRTAQAVEKSARATSTLNKPPPTAPTMTPTGQTFCVAASFDCSWRAIKIATAGVIGKMERALTVQLQHAAK